MTKMGKDMFMLHETHNAESSARNGRERKVIKIWNNMKLSQWYITSNNKGATILFPIHLDFKIAIEIKDEKERYISYLMVDY